MTFIGYVGQHMNVMIFEKNRGLYLFDAPRKIFLSDKFAIIWKIQGFFVLGTRQGNIVFKMLIFGAKKLYTATYEFEGSMWVDWN